MEQLAGPVGETIDPDITSRINELKQDEASAHGAGQGMGLTRSDPVGVPAAFVAAADPDPRCGTAWQRRDTTWGSTSM